MRGFKQAPHFHRIPILTTTNPINPPIVEKGGLCSEGVRANERVQGSVGGGEGQEGGEERGGGGKGVAPLRRVRHTTPHFLPLTQPSHLPLALLYSHIYTLPPPLFHPNYLSTNHTHTPRRHPSSPHLPFLLLPNRLSGPQTTIANTPDRH